MRRSPRRLLARRATLALAASPILLGLGCVPQQRYDDLRTAYRSLEEQNVALQQENDTLAADMTAKDDRLARLEGEVGSLQSTARELEGALDEEMQRTDEYLRRISSVEAGPLPAAVENALRDVVASHPGLVTFDARSGMLRFASDFTFATGSDALTGEAADAIAIVATVLNDDDASDLMVKVVGHTDNVPIRKAETKAKHPTNMHLSVHRAISVQRALASAGVESSRIQVAGHGPYMPIVANGVRGAAENRRVEIFLTAMPTGTRPAAARSLATPEVATPAPRRPEPNK